jgi:hypothetical protein
LLNPDHGKQTIDQIHTVLDAVEAEELFLLDRWNAAVIDAANFIIATNGGRDGAFC